MPKFDLPLQRLYGPAWSTPQWNPGFKCVWTLEKDQSGHHCPEPDCDGPIKTSCYRKLHVAFCCVVVEMPRNGQLRFCGHRFQVESPKACALHHWGPHNENKFFQDAKKGLSFHLPPVFPHEQPEWEMVLSAYGSIRSEVSIRMGISRGRMSFVRVQSYTEDGQPLEVAELAQVTKKEILMGVGPPYPGTEIAVEIEEDQAAVLKQALTEAEEQDEVEFNSPKGYEKYNKLKTDLRAATAWAAQMEKAEEAAKATLQTIAAKHNKKGRTMNLVVFKRLKKRK